MKPDHIIENEAIRIGITNHGAELVSIIRKSDNREYMWSGDSNYWNRVSPVLFPFVGKLVDCTYRFNGNSYDGIPQHGFARDSEFTMVEKLEDTIWFELVPDDNWKMKYPFNFLLRIGYRIEGSKLHVMWTVRNDSGENMSFSIGAHPAFLCMDYNKTEADTDLNIPETDADRLAGYQLNLHTPKTELICGELTAEGTLKKEKRTVALDNGKLKLSKELFEKDALVIDSNDIYTVSIIDPNGNEYLQVKFDTPQLGIWSPAGKNAPFVCIEPWFGRCDACDFAGELQDREYGNTIEPGHSFNKEYVIEIL